METKKVTYKSIINATIHADNSSDEERVFNISADVTMRGSSVDNFNNGQVTTSADSQGNNMPSCSFSESYTTNVSVNFYQVDSTEMQCAMLSAINEFIKSVRNNVPVIDEVSHS